MIIANGEYSEHYFTNMYAQTISSQFWVMFYDENKAAYTPWITEWITTYSHEAWVLPYPSDSVGPTPQMSMEQSIQ